jgi:hypothetical protein
VRLLLFIVVSVVVAVSAVPPLSNMTSLMVTGLAILTGFTFTALFSDHALAESGLPRPTTETGRYELTKLETLSKNFRARSEYFIVMSVLCVALLVCVGAGVDLRSPLRWVMNVSGLSDSPFFVSAQLWYRAVSVVLYALLVFICTFMFLENLYTFYRLTETILAILNTRRDYLSNNNQS